MYELAYYDSAVHRFNHYTTRTPTGDNVDRLHVSRKEGGRGLASIEDSVDASIKLPQYSDWYAISSISRLICHHEGELITAIRNGTDNVMANRMTIIRKWKWEEKQQINNIYNQYYLSSLTLRMGTTNMT